MGNCQPIKSAIDEPFLCESKFQFAVTAAAGAAPTPTPLCIYYIMWIYIYKCGRAEIFACSAQCVGILLPLTNKWHGAMQFYWSAVRVGSRDCRMGGFTQRPWTPTKRRGPIAAEHRSPGPACVALRSSIGKQKFLNYFSYNSAHYSLMPSSPRKWLC